MERFFRKALLVILSCLIVCGSAALTYGFWHYSDDVGQLVTEGTETLQKIFADSKNALAARVFAESLPEQEELVSEFAQSAYYQRSEEERYQQYQAINKQLSIEEVVNRVNMDLDRPFYERAQLIDDTAAFPLLVNKYHYLPEDYVPEDLVVLPSGHQLTAQSAQAFEALQNAAGSEGMALRITTAYRSIAEQDKLYHSFRARGSYQATEQRVARPGYSEHHTGNALDIYAANEAGRFGETAAYEWLETNCWRYGFIVRYPQGQENITGYQFEPWHITYVGTEAAETMHANQIETLEEYVVKILQRSE